MYVCTCTSTTDREKRNHVGGDVRRIMMFQQFVLYYIFVQCAAAITPLLVSSPPMTGHCFRVPRCT